MLAMQDNGAAYPVADARTTILTRLKGVYKRDDDTSSRVANCMAERNGTTVMICQIAAQHYN